jgi:hypothetical protein
MNPLLWHLYCFKLGKQGKMDSTKVQKMSPERLGQPPGVSHTKSFHKNSMFLPLQGYSKIKKPSLEGFFFALPIWR